MRIQVKDVRLFFDVEGAKLRPDGDRMRDVPTLLLLLGGPGFDHSGFKLGFPRLTDIVQIVYLDHRGNGRSDAGSKAHWNLAAWADDIRAFCEALEIQRPIVMGHSFGGIVAMLYAARFPEHPSKLILSSTSARPVGERSYSMFDKLGGPSARAAAVDFWTSPGPESAKRYIDLCIPLYTRKQLPRGFHSRAVRNPEMLLVFIENELKSLALAGQLQHIKCPTLVLAGEDDPITPVGDAEEIAASLPPGLLRFERFPNAGHHLYWDQPEAFFEAVRKFILM
jgi:pimeloyl-ACP methyl ester carboxylesterase